ncbi:ESX secretion-associated protein EspG [Solihabitans fulvus]|uniref:ESX secretion-associated protein EspG n=1 Tax=Solihabitans fulvus TaxID=1892852 RepID=A0A5B2XDJ2_9PSEU|nr:ESX secretion-associated protein EspG [Solihabitans fulvus]KAA2261031.1 ESX secretion-associated protein EspG [Solihabitans fulvus]
MTVSYSFSLSHAALDIVWEELKLGSRVFPFDIPHHGQTFDERRRIRDAVFRDLESRNLASRGRLSPEAEEALRLLVQFEYGFTVIGMLDRQSEQQLLARGGAAGDLGVLAVLDDRMLKVDTMRSSALIHAMVSLLPQERPGPGQSVTISTGAPAPARRHDEDEDFDSMFEPVAPTGGHAAQNRAVEVIMERPRLRAGQFSAYASGRHGRQNRSPELVWFDTDAGRYLMQTRREQDGNTWITIAPTDSTRIVSQLGQLLNSLNAG